MCQKDYGSGGIRTHAPEETGALNQRLRPLGHATFLSFMVQCESSDAFTLEMKAIKVYCEFVLYCEFTNFCFCSIKYRGLALKSNFRLVKHSSCFQSRSQANLKQC